MKVRKDNILLVTSELPPLPGGIGNHTHNLAGQLKALGFEVTVLADYRTFDCEEEILFDKKQSYIIKRIARKKRRFWMYLARIKLYRKLLPQAALVMASGKFPLWLVGFGSWGFSKTPKLALLHGSEVNFQKPLLKVSINKALKRFTKGIAVSQFTADLVKDIPLEVHRIPNGIKLEDWALNKSVQKKKEEAYPVLITVGNLTERKGQANVIKILPRLITKYPHIKYECIGLPTELNKLEALVQKFGVGEQIVFYGRLSDGELKEKLVSSDVFVMLSNKTKTGDVEGFGIAILEANAMGIPAIGAKGSGIEEAILNGKSGFLIESSDGVAFSNALETLLKNKEEFRKNALEWAKKHDWGVIVKQYQKVIESCI